MRYGEAFARLGYVLSNPRQDWTAGRADGVCVSLVRTEVDWKARPQRLDTRLNCDPISEWGVKPGNRTRIAHITRAVAEFGGWVDAVIVDRRSGGEVQDAEPWQAAERKHRWRIVDFDATTGHFSIEAQRV